MSPGTGELGGSGARRGGASCGGRSPGGACPPLCLSPQPGPGSAELGAGGGAAGGEPAGPAAPHPGPGPPRPPALPYAGTRLQPELRVLGRKPRASDRRLSGVGTKRPPQQPWRSCRPHLLWPQESAARERRPRPCRGQLVGRPAAGKGPALPPAGQAGGQLTGRRRPWFLPLGSEDPGMGGGREWPSEWQRGECARTSASGWSRTGPSPPCVLLANDPHRAPSRGSGACLRLQPWLAPVRPSTPTLSG